jgi:cyanophycin synthetase
MALDKRQTNRQLAQLALPVPRQVATASAAEAVAALKLIGAPVVVKPARGNQGRGITVGVQEPQDVAAAFQCAHAEGTGVLIEEFVSGNDYRLTVVGGKFAAALLCIPPLIEGDGVRRVRQLIEELNAEPDRDKMRLSPVAFDNELEGHLGAHGYTLDSVPAPGAIIPIRKTGHVSRGGIPIDVTDLVHRDNREASERAARAVGLDVAGVDFVSPDISRSYREVGGRIVEVNSRPGIGMHLWPREGKSRDMGGAILDHLYPDSTTACVPLLLVAGSRGTGSVARFAENLLRAKGLTVGMSLKRGAYINGRPLDIPMNKLVRAPSTLLRDPSIEAMVAAVSLPHVAKHGLNLEKCDAVSLMSLDRETLTDDYANGLAVLLKANRGRFIVGSGNILARQALSQLDRSRIVLIAAGPNDPEVSDHIAAKGPAVVQHWSAGGAGPQMTLVEAGRDVVSAPMLSLSQARPIRVEAIMHAFALVHVAKLGEAC